MQFTAGLIVAFALALITLAVRLVRRHPVSFEIFAQDALVAFGVGIAAGLTIVPTIGISWAFIHGHGTLTQAIIAPYDSNELMFELVAGAAATMYLAIKAYLEHMPRCTVTKPEDFPDVPDAAGLDATDEPVD